MIFSRIPTITVEGLHKALEEKSVHLVDVRSKEEYAEMHIEAAQLVPLPTVEQADFAHDKPIVCQCRSGMRSAKACKLLRKKGYEVLNLKGGILAWMEAGLPVVR